MLRRRGCRAQAESRVPSLGMQLACGDSKNLGRPEMSIFKDPFDAKNLLGRRCSCGGAHAQGDHDRLEAVPAAEERRWNRVVDAAVLRAVFPADATRRRFLKTVGSAT